MWNNKHLKTRTSVSPPDVIWLAVLQERSILLRKWFDLLTLHKEDLAKLITFESVSMMKLTTHTDVMMCCRIQTVEWTENRKEHENISFFNSLTSSSFWWSNWLSCRIVWFITTSSFINSSNVCEKLSDECSEVKVKCFPLRWDVDEQKLKYWSDKQSEAATESVNHPQRNCHNRSHRNYFMMKK